MKKTKVTRITPPDKTSIRTNQRMYNVFITSGMNKRFTSRREAEAFTAKLSRYMQDSLHELNKMYAEAWHYYRDLWFYLDHHKGNTLDRKLYNILDAIHRDFGQSVKPAPESLGNTLPVNGFFSVVRRMEEIWPLMADFYFHRRIYHSQHICRLYGQRCAQIRAEFINICQ